MLDLIKFSSQRLRKAFADI